MTQSAPPDDHVNLTMTITGESIPFLVPLATVLCLPARAAEARRILYNFSFKNVLSDSNSNRQKNTKSQRYQEPTSRNFRQVANCNSGISLLACAVDAVCNDGCFSKNPANSSVKRRAPAAISSARGAVVVVVVTAELLAAVEEDPDTAMMTTAKGKSGLPNLE